MKRHSASAVVRTLFFRILVGLMAIRPLASQDLSPRQIYDTVKDSVLIVLTEAGDGRSGSQGSGVKLPNGYIVTNQHVIENASKIVVGRHGEFVPANLVAFDKRKDLALLEAPALKATPVILGSTSESELKVGDPVCAIGAPKEQELTISNGIVSQLRFGDPPHIQTTAPMSHGSSGGGLFDGKGRLVGITTFGLKDSQNLNFAMPVEWVVQLKPGQGILPVLRASSEWTNQAASLQREHKYAELLTLTQAMVKAVPEDDQAWIYIGGAYADNQRFTESLDAYRKAQDLGSPNEDLWYNLGVVNEKLGRITDAFDCYQAALRLDPKNVNAWNNLGVVYRKQGKPNEALDACNRAVKIDPAQSEIWFNLGVMQGRLGRYQESVDAFQEALKRRNDDARIWNNLGAALGRLDRYAEAVEANLQATKLNMGSGSAWHNLGLGYGALGKLTESLDALRQAVKIGPEEAETWADLGLAYGRLGRGPDGEDAFRQALRLEPKNLGVMIRQGNFFAERKLYPLAIASYSKALEIDPKHAQALFQLGMSQVQSGNKDAALEIVKKLRSIDSGKADQLFNEVFPR